jgi:hypothetical protein
MTATIRERSFKNKPWLRPADRDLSTGARALTRRTTPTCCTGALKQMQYRSGLVDGFLARIGLDLTPFSNLHNWRSLAETPARTRPVRGFSPR